MRHWLLAAAFAAASASACLASPEGSYVVEGQNPDGGSRYRGTVEVRRTGEFTYEVTWEVGGTRFVGTGLADDETIVVGYTEGKTVGITYFKSDGSGGWKGLWTYFGQTRHGYENWTPR